MLGQSHGMAFVAFLMASVLASTSWANAFNVKPVRVFLGPGQLTQTLEITNESGRTLSLSLNAVSWSQDAAGGQLEAATEEVVFFPKLFLLEPGATRSVRVGLKSTTAEALERTYRLYIEELPTQREEQGTTLQVLLRVGIPIFFAPQQDRVTASIDAVTLQGCALSFVVSNTGSSHFRAQSLRAEFLGADHTLHYTQDLGGRYFLAGAAGPFAVEVPAEPCAEVQRARIALVADKVQTQYETDRE